MDSDVLRRHQLRCKERGALPVPEPPTTRRQKFACVSCVKLRARCDQDSPCTRCRKRGTECVRSPSDAIDMTGSTKERTWLGVASGAKPENHLDTETQASLPVRTFDSRTPISMDLQCPTAAESEDDNSGMDASSNIWKAPAYVDAGTQTQDPSSVPASIAFTQAEECSFPSPCLTTASCPSWETGDESKQAWSGTNTKAGKDRRRVPQACIACRQRKIRCPGEEPACSRCVKADRSCDYSDKRKRGERNRSASTLSPRGSDV